MRYFDVNANQGRGLWSRRPDGFEPNVISLAPTTESRIASLLPTFTAAGRAFVGFLAKTWVTASLVLTVALCTFLALVFAVLSMVKQ